MFITESWINLHKILVAKNVEYRTNFGLKNFILLKNKADSKFQSVQNFSLNFYQRNALYCFSQFEYFLRFFSNFCAKIGEI
ncbi:hypothetical protein BpHYR1_006553 [Brachionus plicatilis]|uniref:Uncharacterized protein n=1 Tax=Brachionus plicatilis TaxID=10195 RepID=A0A3M7SZC2_BRAPC|nr:hypothetical protein BpHYR1_006553 [Brachionus plicatilis]